MQKIRIQIEKQGWEPTIKEDGDSFFAFHPYMPGVVSSGSSEAEARENWADALEIYLDHCREFDLPVPSPTHIKVKFVTAKANEPESSPVTATFAYC